MNKRKGTIVLNVSYGSTRCENAFAAFPRLGSSEYLEYVRTAETAILPPEALARAYRQLPPEDEASAATLKRLFRRQPSGRWDYLGPLVAYARKRSNANDYEDLLQDALTKILQILPTARGEFAERAWNSFCRRELSEAWRARFGRRGERLPQEDSIDGENHHENGDFLPRGLTSRLSTLRFKPNQVAIIEEIALGVVAELPSEFFRTVASAAWFQDERPKHSGRKESLVGKVPLTTLFPDKSRYQIMRAEAYADAQLAAALLAAPNLELDRDWNPVLEALKAKAPQIQRRARERKQ